MDKYTKNLIKVLDDTNYIKQDTLETTYKLCTSPFDNKIVVNDVELKNMEYFDISNNVLCLSSVSGYYKIKIKTNKIKSLNFCYQLEADYLYDNIGYDMILKQLRPYLKNEVGFYDYFGTIKNSKVMINDMNILGVRHIGIQTNKLYLLDYQLQNIGSIPTYRVKNFKIGDD